MRVRPAYCADRHRLLSVALDAQQLVFLAQPVYLRKQVRRHRWRLRMWRHAADADPCRDLSPQCLSAETRRWSSLASDLTERRRDHQLNGLASVLLGKRPTLTFYSTPLGSSSLVQLSVHSEGTQSVHDQLSVGGSPQFLFLYVFGQSGEARSVQCLSLKELDLGSSSTMRRAM